MKKIMFILTTYGIGGSSTVARNLLDCLVEENFDIVLLTERLSDRHYPINPRIKAIDLAISGQKDFLAKVFNVARHLLSMRRRIARESPDVIISFGAQANCYTLLSLLFRFKKGPKIIITEHSEEMFLRTKGKNPRYRFSKFFYRTLMKALYNRADCIITVSKSIARHVKKLFLVSYSKVRVIYNPVDIKKIKGLCRDDDPLTGFKNNVPCIGTVSRLSYEKGIYFLIQGFKILLDKIDARLIVVGDGTDRSRLEKMTEDLGIKENVFFTGWVDNPYMYLRKMDVFVLPSLWEGFPNVILEAMACGIPVIATDSTGGIKEVIKDGVNGLLIEPKSPFTISESVYGLLSDEKKKQDMAKEAYKSVRQFDIKRIKEQYKALISN